MRDDHKYDADDDKKYNQNSAAAIITAVNKSWEERYRDNKKRYDDMLRKSNMFNN